MKKNRQLKKDQRNAARKIKNINRMLKEDVYSGRFEIRQIDRRDFADINRTYDIHTISEWCEPVWHYSLYLISVADNEDPSRNVAYWCRWSDSFGLCDLLSDEPQENQYISVSGISTIEKAMNEFIVQSDFWKKHKEIEYARTHWYSGKELERMIAYGGEKWKSADAYMKACPDRFSSAEDIKDTENREDAKNESC